MHSHQEASLVSFESESVVPSPRDLALCIAIVPLHTPAQRHHCLERVWKAQSSSSARCSSSSESASASASCSSASASCSSSSASCWSSSASSKLCLFETITHSSAQEVEVDTKDISVARMGKSTYSITFSQSNTDLNQTKTTLLISTYLPWALRTVDDQHLSIPISDLPLQVQRCWVQVTRKDIRSDIQVTSDKKRYNLQKGGFYLQWPWIMSPLKS